MATQTNGIKAILKDLETGKKTLRTEYERSTHAIDVAIRILSEAKMDPTDYIGGPTVYKGPGRPLKGEVDIKSIIRQLKGKGERGRPIGSKSLYEGNISADIMQIIAGHKKFIHSRDIVGILKKKIPNSDSPEFGKKVSVLLASLKKQDRLVTYSEGGYRRNMYWGLNEWLTPEGKMIRTRDYKK